MNLFGRVSSGCVVSVALLLCGCNRSPSDYLAAGDRILQAGKPQDAILEYKNALRRDARFGEAYLHLADAYLKLNDPAGAFSSLSEGVKLRPDDEHAAIRLADMCLVAFASTPQKPTHLYDRAVELSNQWFQKHPGSFDVLRLKGSIALIDRQPAAAAEWFRKALEIRHDDRQAVLGLAQAKMQTSNFEAGEQLVVELLKTELYGPAYDFLYLHYLQAGKPEPAEALLRQRLSRDPKNQDVALQLAAHLFRTRQQALADTTITELISRSEDKSAAYLAAGDFYARVNSWRQALALLRKGREHQVRS